MATSTLGRNLRAVREAKGWSRATLAVQSDTSEPTIARVELYGTQPRVSTLYAWADALGIDPGELFATENGAA